MRISAALRVLACAIFITALSSLAQAQATRTWVSGVGDDVNPCSRTAPCKTYAGAISKTAVNGEISTLDPGGFGAVTITKSITIEGTQGQGYGSILHNGTTGVTILFDSFAGTDQRKTVRLHNLNINGGDTGLRGVRIVGAAAVAGTEVFIEDCVIDGSFAAPGQGIIDTRSGGGLLSVTDCKIRNMLGAGIGTGPLNGSPILKVVVSGTTISNCGSGLAVSTNTKATVYNSVFSNNTNGIFAEDLDAGATTTEVSVDHCVVSNNTTGFNANANTTTRVSNTTALNNGSLFTAAGGGQVLSYNNNQTGGIAFGGPVPPS